MCIRTITALGEHALSVAALAAALEATKESELLFSEALTVRARALVGEASAGLTTATVHWDKETGKERVLEVMGRMATGGGSGSSGLHEKLLLHGL